MKKLDVNCVSKEIIIDDLSQAEVENIQYMREQGELQILLNSLSPSPEEIKQAEFELKCLNLLLEVGLI